MSRIHPQKRCGENGQPDVIIKTDNMLALLEIKTDSKRGLTEKQELDAFGGKTAMSITYGLKLVNIGNYGSYSLLHAIGCTGTM